MRGNKSCSTTRLTPMISGLTGDHDRPFHRSYCDLIKIEGSCDGPLQHAVWLKQVQSIGVRMW